MRLFLKTLSAAFLLVSCSGPSTPKADEAKKPPIEPKFSPIMVRATNERRLEWFQDGMSRTDSGADSAEYIPNRLTIYYEGKPTVFNGTVDIDTTLSVKEEFKKRYEKAHKPIVYVNTVEDNGLPSDALDITDDQDVTHNCDSIHDYGNKIVGYYQSSRTLALTSFSKNEVIKFHVTAPKAEGDSTKNN